MNQKPEWCCTVGHHVEDGDSCWFFILFLKKKNYYFDSRNIVFVYLFCLFFLYLLFFTASQEANLCTVMEVWECFRLVTLERSHTLAPAQ